MSPKLRRLEVMAVDPEQAGPAREREALIPDSRRFQQ